MARHLYIRKVLVASAPIFAALDMIWGPNALLMIRPLLHNAQARFPCLAVCWRSLQRAPSAPVCRLYTWGLHVGSLHIPTAPQYCPTTRLLTPLVALAFVPVPRYLLPARPLTPLIMVIVAPTFPRCLRLQPQVNLQAMILPPAPPYIRQSTPPQARIGVPMRRLHSCHPVRHATSQHPSPTAETQQHPHPRRPLRADT